MEKISRKHIMNITFQPLAISHFPLLLQWLETPHVKAWWDQDVNWTPKLIEQKFGSYVHQIKHSKLKNKLTEKPTYAYIISFDEIPIGYIQYYNKYDFSHEQEYEMIELSENCGAIDWYIGEPNFIGKGIGSKALSMFLDNYIFPKSDHVFVDSESKNTGAIKAYEKVGFKEIKRVNNGTIICMIKEKK